MSIADYLEDGADYIEDEPEMCGTDECEFNEGGFCLKDMYYAVCPYDGRK